MNDDFLYKFRKPPRRAFAVALYQRISKPMQTPFRTSTLRLIALTFSILAVITAVWFFSPSTRALADTLIRQFGGYIFTQGTPQPDLAKKEVAGDQKAALQAEKQQMKDQPQANKEDTASFAPDAAGASQLAGFTVLTPAYIPEGYTPTETKNGSNGWAVTQENGGMTAMTYYQNLANEGFLTIEELKYEQGRPRTVERPEIEDVTVRGQPGVWTPDLNDGKGGKNVLVWDENGVTYLVVSNKLTLDESMQVAESLGK